MRRDELLTRTIAPDQCGEAAAGEDQPVVPAQQEGHRYSVQRVEVREQRLLQRWLRRF